MTSSEFDETFPYRVTLDTAVIGMESEFTVFVDEKEVVPGEYWRRPTEFMSRPVLKRTRNSSQLPTGGAVYFDRDVLEVVTPVIELAPQSTERMVRNLWEQIGFLREELSLWETRSGHRVRLKGFSSHYNVSFEIPREKRHRNRTIQKLALLLAHILPIPIIVLGANRRSTGVGVRPRRNRIEITFDFTPDPGLTAATAAAIVGITREITSWDSYLLSQLDELPIAIPLDVTPGRHTTRKGWLTKDYHYERSPFMADIDAPTWRTTTGDMMSLREMAFRTAWFFRDSIRRYSDPFTVRLLFAVLRGQVPSLLDLNDRPRAYEDVGRLCRWGMVLPELENYRDLDTIDPGIEDVTLQQHRSWRAGQRNRRDEHRTPVRRSTDPRGGLAPPWSGEKVDRRLDVASLKEREQRRGNRRIAKPAMSGPPISRSIYEEVFRKLGSGGKLKIGKDVLIPVGMKGWSQAVFRRESDGSEQTLSIDQLLKNMNRWIS